MNLKIKLVVLFSGMFFLAFPLFVNAQAIIGSALNQLNPVVEKAGVSKRATVESTIGDVAAILLSIAGIFFFILMIYGGLRWMTARGDDSQIDSARKTIIAAVIGLIIMVGSYGFSIFVTSGILGNIQGTGPGGGSVVGEGDLGCCLVQVQSEGSGQFTQRRQKYWSSFMTTQPRCLQYTAAEGTQLTSSPEWRGDITDDNACQVEGRKKKGL